MNRLYRRLMVALVRQDRHGLAELVRQHPEAHDGCDRRETPVAMIAAVGLDLLEAAFAAGLSPDAGHRAESVQTFLQRAAADGDVETVALCIRYGADLERRNASDETVLAYACSWGHLSVVRLLVEAGADVNAVEQDPEHGIRNTALDCCGKHPEIAEYLRSVGAMSITDVEPGPSRASGLVIRSSFGGGAGPPSRLRRYGGRPSPRHERRMVDLTGEGWNQVDVWLSRLDCLRTATSPSPAMC